VGNCQCLSGVWGCAKTVYSGCGASCPTPQKAQCGDSCQSPMDGCLCQCGGGPNFSSCSCSGGTWQCKGC
jgi:hypothetical protein